MADLPSWQPGDTITADQLNALVAAIQELQDAQDGGGGGDTADNSTDPPVDPYTRIFPAEITGNGTDGSKYTWKEKTNIGQSVVDFGTPGTDGRACTDATDASAAVEVNGWLWVPTGVIVRMEEIADGSDFRYQFAVPIPAPPTQDGSTAYVLGYSKDTKALAWLEQDDCS